MLIKQYDLRRELELLQFDKKYAENIEKTINEVGQYEDKYIAIWKAHNGFISYELK